MKVNTKFVVTVLVILGFAGTLGSVVDAGSTNEPDRDCQDHMLYSDLWINTRLEAAYLFNPHLNNLTIDTFVHEGAVFLTGTVRSDIDKDLAGEIASSVDGVRSVHNSLAVKDIAPKKEADPRDVAFLQKVRDATLTAKVKTRLMANSHISALDIDVETNNNVVQLNGEVTSDTERQLAGYIARNTSGVASVSNRLKLLHSG